MDDRGARATNVSERFSREERLFTSPNTRISRKQNVKNKPDTRSHGLSRCQTNGIAKIRTESNGIRYSSGPSVAMVHWLRSLVSEKCLGSKMETPVPAVARLKQRQVQI